MSVDHYLSVLKSAKPDLTKCAICDSQGPLRRDHRYTDVEQRGMLCEQCDSGLSNFRDNAELLTFAVMYLMDMEELAREAD